MDFLYNPHLHVKIWLTKSKHEFMNIENQKRLIEMREANPDDIIYLVYDSSLLNEKSQLELQQYCKEHECIPINADSEIFKKQLKTHNEKTLYLYYKDEINNLDNGGNLAVASDILRWLPAVYRYGTYTDLDFPVNTNKLPKNIIVKAPLILNIGNANFGKKTFLLSNNDFIAVSNPIAAAKEINKIQANLIKQLKNYDADFIKKIGKEAGKNILNVKIFNYLKNCSRPEAIYIEKSGEANKHNLSSRELRAQMHKIMTDKSKFLNFYKTKADESEQEVILRLRKQLKTQLTFIKWLFFRKEFNEIKAILSQKNDNLIESLMRKERNLYLKSIVICTTGPIEISNALFKNYILNRKDFNQSVFPLSFYYYDLQEAFQSKNSIPINVSMFKMFRFIGTNDGDLNDSSWLEDGITRQKERGKKIQYQKEALYLSLSYKLEYIKERIQKHIQKLESRKLNHFLKMFDVFKSSQEAQLYLLQKTLNCFQNYENENFFDTLQFKNVLNEINQYKKHAFIGIFPLVTKKLIKNLQSISYDATIYGFTKNKKISIIKLNSKQQRAPVHHQQKKINNYTISYPQFNDPE
ncbi:MAG: hypothetical protein H0X63_12450 [Flavobacteriales bacterium]|nr:hypothetical protein [Flavobacteriales bacterium]